MKELNVLGINLKPGNVVKVWWGRQKEMLLETRKHPKYEEMFGISGAMIGNFGGTEMTIEPDRMYTVYIAD